ncbi:hypothetical protein NIES2100_52050 [Calothrix sp. NIES-2100]|nr:hypothetical protein NIES2100_52050 [Calothrix sp. NIES-2100]
MQYAFTPPPTPPRKRGGGYDIRHVIRKRYSLSQLDAVRFYPSPNPSLLAGRGAFASANAGWGSERTSTLNLVIRDGNTSITTIKCSAGTQSNASQY